MLSEKFCFIDKSKYYCIIACIYPVMKSMKYSSWDCSALSLSSYGGQYYFRERLHTRR